MSLNVKVDALPWQRTVAGSALAGCILGVADAAWALGRYGFRLPRSTDRAAFGFALLAVVALSVTVTVSGLAGLAALAGRALRPAPDRVQRALVMAAVVAGSLALGLAAFSGSGVRRSGLRPLALGMSMALGAGITAWLWYRRKPLAAVVRLRPGTVTLTLASGALGAYTLHATVYARLYPALHGILAACAVAAMAAVAMRVARRCAAAMAPWALVAVATVGVAGAWTLGNSQAFRALARQGAPLGRYPLALLGRWAPRGSVASAGLDDTVSRGPHLPLQGLDIVLVTVDALRADRLRVNGGRGRMPVLDAISAQGVVFQRAYCTTPHTSYSLASIMLGKYARSVLALPVARPQETLAQQVGRCGYSTAGFFPPAVFSVDADRFGDLHTRGFDFGYRREAYADAPVRVREVRDWLAARRHDERLFVWVHLFEPHEPYAVHAEHPFGEGRVDRYDAEAAAADDAIGSLRDLFARAHRRTAWVITADHGEEFGEHGGSFHGTSLYDEQVRVPLIVDVPGVPHRVVDAPVSLVDIAPTILAGLGLSRPVRERGSDLGPLVNGDPAATRAYASTGSLRMVVEGDSKLILDLSDGTLELYDLAADPTETRNLADSDGARTARLRGLIERWEASHARVESQGQPRTPVTSASIQGESSGDDLPDVVNRAIQGDRTVAVEVAAVLQATSGIARVRAARVLGDLGVRDTVEVNALADALAAGDATLAREAGLSLALLQDPRGLSVARTVLASPDQEISRRAALGLARLGDASGVGVLSAWLLDPFAHEAARDDVARALRALRAPTAYATWEALLGDMRMAPIAAAALGELGDHRAIAPLESLVVRPTYPLTIRAAADALVSLGAPDARARLADALVVTDPLPDVWPLLRRVGEPGHAVAGSARLRLVGTRATRVPMGLPATYQRLYIRTRATAPSTLTIAPYGLAATVPAGEHEVTLELDRTLRVTGLRIQCDPRVEILGVAVR